ncbi:MAG: type II toxin-antitoxin system RelE/ParE family toxin [Planctomycetes bacterium]|nr:type II toxin-antitoxin system RelE/ParE family toxin [Planctomycetota bacterium]
MYHTAASEELLDALGYLELRVLGLGRPFLAEVQRAEGILLAHPEAGVVIRPGIRKYILRKFPYSLLYSIVDDGLLVIAHQSRRPGYWSGRARKAPKTSDGSGT